MTSARTILAPIEVLRWKTSLRAETISDQAYGGKDLFDPGFRWVWNVAANPNGEIRELRFWTREIIAPETTVDLSLDNVINSILPPIRKQYPAGEVANTIFCIGRDLLASLRVELNGKLAANSSFFPREGLERFLRTRWLGAVRPAEATR